MSVKCGWASIDENGRARGGKAGDQTGRETRVADWYDFGQSVVFRFEDREIAKKFAKALKTLCVDYNVGYDQNERTTIFIACRKAGWKLEKVSKTAAYESDCSELVATAVNLAFGKEVLGPDTYTGNLNSRLRNIKINGKPAFKEITGTKYTKQSSYLKTGDILNAPNHHVIGCLEDGPNAGQTSTSSKVAEPTLKLGSSGSEVRKLQKNLNALKITDNDGNKLEEDGKFGRLTGQAVRKFQKKYKLEQDQIYGPKSAEQMGKLIK